MSQGALELSCRVLRGLRVNTGRMLQNLEITGALILAERVMFALSERYGRQTAHDLVHSCAMTAYEKDVSFADVLMANRDIAVVLTRAQLNTLLDPQQYLGLAGSFVDHVLASLE